MADRKTIKKQSRYEIEIKHSRFIGCAFPVTTAADAERIIAEVRAENRKARHNVYAYIAGGATGYSDDGEPKKTAGLPIYDYISKEGYGDLLITVTRYFGGILLGTGGLVKAYTDAAKGAVAAAGDAYVAHCAVWRYETDWNGCAAIAAASSEMAVSCETEYGEPSYITVAVRPEDSERLLGLCAAIVRGKEPERLEDADKPVSKSGKPSF